MEGGQSHLLTSHMMHSCSQRSGSCGREGQKDRCSHHLPTVGRPVLYQRYARAFWVPRLFIRHTSFDFPVVLKHTVTSSEPIHPRPAREPTLRLCSPCLCSSRLFPCRLCMRRLHQNAEVCEKSLQQCGKTRESSQTTPNHICILREKVDQLNTVQLRIFIIKRLH